MMLLFPPVVKCGPTSGCYSVCVHCFCPSSLLDQTQTNSDCWGKGALFSRCAFTSIKGEMPKPAQDQKRWQACGEVLLFCIWWTILEVIKPGLCPLVQQLGLHSISRLFILAQSQGDMVFSIMLVWQMKRGGEGDFTGQVCDFLVIYVRGTFKSSEDYEPVQI